MKIGGFYLGQSSDLPQEVEMWYHFPGTIATIFTLIGVYFFDIVKLIIIAAIIDFCFAILKYLIVSSYKFIYYSIGHSIVLWIWGIGTLIYFIIVKPWWLGAYALGYHIFIGSIIGLPGIIIVDGIAVKILGRHPKYYAAEKFYSRINIVDDINSDEGNMKTKYDTSIMDSEVNNKIKTEESINKDKIFCRYCGAKLPNYALFCNKCGKKVKI